MQPRKWEVGRTSARSRPGVYCQMIPGVIQLRRRDNPMSTASTATRPDTGRLQAIANQLRIHSIESTTAAGSGHPTSCCSAAEIVAALFFGVMRYDPKDPRNPDNDRFILSKGHAAPILY